MTTVDLRLGDCLELMRDLPPASIDAILTDLPYGTTACKWDVIIPFAPMWEQVKRILKRRGAFVTTASQPFTSALVMSNLAWFKYEWIWEKNVATDCMNVKNKPMKLHENVLIFSPGTTANHSDRRMIYNPQGLTPTIRRRLGTDYGPNEGTFKVPRPSHHAYTQEWCNYPVDVLRFEKESDIVHPTQKPVALYAYLIRTYTNPGDVVLDICMGSGTTGVAAVTEGRSFIGYELREDYFHVAERRIADALAQLHLAETPAADGTAQLSMDETGD